MKIKRAPLLYDEFMANTNPKNMLPEEQKPYEFLRGRMSDAKVFAFDHDAARYAARMIHDHPEAIAHDVEFAIPPFKKMWIEFPYPEFFRIMGGDLKNDGTEDERIGYLYDGPRAYVLSGGTRVHQYAAAVPIRYRLNQQFTLNEENTIVGYTDESRVALDAYMWGSVWPKIQPLGLMRALREHHSMEWWFMKEWFDTLPQAELKRRVERVMRSTAGDLRNIVAMTLFLNRTRELIVEDEVRGAPGFVRSKPRTLVRHSIVRLRLDPGPLLKRIYTPTGHGPIWRREHDVRGHFAHDKIWRGHAHEHDAVECAVNQWRCLICGGKKWWKKEHHRGKRDHGRVKTSYEVRP